MVAVWGFEKVQFGMPAKLWLHPPGVKRAIA
jgi:hypothetical protein